MRDSKRNKADLKAVLLLPLVLIFAFVVVRMTGLQTQIYGKQFLLFYYIFACFWARN
jgi:hypothetical protein